MKKLFIALFLTGALCLPLSLGCKSSPDKDEPKTEKKDNKKEGDETAKKCEKCKKPMDKCECKKKEG